MAVVLPPPQDAEEWGGSASMFNTGVTKNEEMNNFFVRKVQSTAFPVACVTGYDEGLIRYVGDVMWIRTLDLTLFCNSTY